MQPPDQTAPSVALAIEGLAVVRRDRALFGGLSLRLAAGGAALVTGPNGAGKSSLLRVLAGLLRPAAGTVAVAGGVALLAEQPALDVEASVARALGFWARLDGCSPGAVAAALDDLALGTLAEVPVRMLSTGQRRRVAMARVLVSGAGTWLLDEPANGLDAAAAARLEALIARHRSGGGIAVVATHLPVALPDAIAVTL